jgi:Proliferating cell nuclear antigen, C-terminal domain
MQSDVSSPNDKLFVSCTASGVKFTIKGGLGSGTIPLVTNAAENVYLELCEPFERCWSLREISAVALAPFETERVIITCNADKHFIVKYPIHYRQFDGEVGHIRYAIRSQ